ncbi:MAG: response regulator [Fimbriimonadaceae bacterium]|nr:response regulator [Fimbriimonadaceae bacterium]
MPEFMPCPHCGAELVLRTGRVPAGALCPVCHKPLQPAAAPAPAAPTARKVLVVEDDDATLAILTTTLKSGGWQVVCAGDSVTALQMARRERPDVIVLDLGLPGGDGFGVMQRLAHLNPVKLIPVVVVTAKDPAEVLSKSREAGARAFLRKPVRPAELLQTVARVAAG